jgi:hypothetical protein
MKANLSSFGPLSEKDEESLDRERSPKVAGELSTEPQGSNAREWTNAMAGEDSAKKPGTAGPRRALLSPGGLWLALFFLGAGPIRWCKIVAVDSQGESRFSGLRCSAGTSATSDRRVLSDYGAQFATVVPVYAGNGDGRVAFVDRVPVGVLQSRRTAGGGRTC